MQKIFSIIFALIIVAHQLYGQKPSNEILVGSWINNKIIDHYSCHNDCVCDTKNYFFDRENYGPLYLSFDTKGKVKITFRYEQRVITYGVMRKDDGSFTICNENTRKPIFDVKYQNDTLAVKFENYWINFTRVSSKDSKTVFAEFVKSIIFRKYHNYIIASEYISKKINLIKINQLNIANIESRLKNFFKCSTVEFAELVSFDDHGSCLPAVALFTDNKKMWVAPRVLGIRIENDFVKFLDTSGTTVLILKPQ